MNDAWAHSAYEASPDCRERGCRWTVWAELERPVYVYRHGDNPESVTIVDRFSVRHRPAEYVAQQVRDFAERCHRYEDGVLE